MVRRSLIKGIKNPVSVWIIGSILSYCVLVVISCGIMAFLVGREIMPPEKIQYGVVISVVISGFVATKILMKLNWKKDYLTVVAAVIAAQLILSLGNLMTGADNMRGLLPTLILTFAGSGSALLLKRKKIRNKYKNKFC